MPARPTSCGRQAQSVPFRPVVVPVVSQSSKSCGCPGGEEVSLRSDSAEFYRPLSLGDRSSHGVQAESAFENRAAIVAKKAARAVNWPPGFPAVASRLLCAFLAIPSAVLAQAWLSPKGEGTVSLSYQNQFVADHVFENGDAHDIGHILSHALTLDVDYSITGNLAVRVALPFVAGKYYGPAPHQLPMDNGIYHSSFQDFTTDVRYRLTKRRVAITPFFRAVIPSNSYTYFAHSAAGRDQREYHLGTNFGRRLNPLIPKAYVQAQYSYAFVERVLGIAPNRSNARVATRLLPDSANLISGYGARDVHAQWPELQLQPLSCRPFRRSVDSPRPDRQVESSGSRRRDVVGNYAVVADVPHRGSLGRGPKRAFTHGGRHDRGEPLIRREVRWRRAGFPGFGRTVRAGGKPAVRLYLRQVTIAALGWDFPLEDCMGARRVGVAIDPTAVLRAGRRESHHEGTGTRSEHGVKEKS